MVLPADSGKIEITAVLPLQLNLDTLVFDYNLKDTVTGLVTIEKFSLAMLEALEITNDIKGFMEAELELSGTVESPVLAGKYALNDASFSGYRFLTFDGSVNYSNNLFSAETLVIPQDSGKFELSASLPLHYNPDSLSFSLNPKDSINGRVLIEKFTLAILQAMNPAGKIAGQLEGELSVSGTVESPNPTGNLRLTNTSVEMREYGINYSDIGLNLNFLRDKIRIDNLLVKSRDGNLTGTGQIDFTSDFYKGDISQSEIELKFNRFQPFNHRQFNMQVNGNATLGGKKGEVIYGGDITIPQSVIFIPAIMRMLGKMTVPEMPKPLLVQELEDMELLADSFYIEQFGPQQADSARFGYLDNFKGNLESGFHEIPG
jgi:translocation and assembly module TamB